MNLAKTKLSLDLQSISEGQRCHHSEDFTEAGSVKLVNISWQKTYGVGTTESESLFDRVF